MEEEVKNIEFVPNEEVVNQESKENINKVEEVKTKIVPKLFMKKDEKVKIQVVGFHSASNGELAFVLPKEYSDEKNFDNLLIKKDYQFLFTRVTYDKLNRYRNRSIIYNSEDKNNTINQLKLREHFLVFHLVDWNLQDEEGKKIELKFDPNGALSDESLDLIYQLPSNMLDLVLASYEKRMNVS